MIVAIILAAAAAAAAPAGGAQAYAEAIYRRLPDDRFDFRQVRYAPVLRNLLAREAAAAHGEVGLIDSVPFCACQDTAEDYAFTTEVRPAPADRAEVLVHLRNGGRSTFRLDMVRLRTGWAVADIHGPERPSLVAYLQRSLPASTRATR